MAPQQPINKQKANAIINIVAGLLFFVAAFNLLTGQGGVDWMWLIVGVLFVAGGIWGLRSP
ncbi:MAG: hypothetical protein IT330_19225 [Anaerolineae bacterium]|nr:hypothetical protein [Anaerolineae bacterium]